ncbi:MAG: nitronate monooxygenase [Bacteroidota bacterium]|nr:nitronate monooxygenase [Bacteroidota bacterium]
MEQSNYYQTPPKSESQFVNRITGLFGIRYPIIQAGMIWCANAELVAAVSNAGGLGLIGSGSMYPEDLERALLLVKQLTSKPYGVNIPLLYPDIDKHIELVIKYEVPIVFTSAGNPKKYTAELKKAGIKVVHVVSSVKFALKAQEAGVDAVVAEGFEAGGHNGRDETTTMVLIPSVAEILDIPVIAGGGIATGKSMAAAMALGADGVQMGSRFVCSIESSAHINFKNAVINSNEGDTMLRLKKLTPVRLLKNEFADKVENAEQSGASDIELAELLGQGRSKKGMFLGDMKEGELEIGQVSGYLHNILPAAEIVAEVWDEFVGTVRSMSAKLTSY